MSAFEKFEEARKKSIVENGLVKLFDGVYFYKGLQVELAENPNPFDVTSSWSYATNLKDPYVHIGPTEYEGTLKKCLVKIDNILKA